MNCLQCGAERGGGRRERRRKKREEEVVAVERDEEEEEEGRDHDLGRRDKGEAREDFGGARLFPVDLEPLYLIQAISMHLPAFINLLL